MLSKHVARLIRQILLLVAVPALPCQNKSNTLTGVITSPTGEPLPGVTVRAAEKYCETDEKGRYRIQLPSTSTDFCCVLQFKKQGYRTLTKAADPVSGVLDIILQTGESKWAPPDWNPSVPKRVGAQMRFLVPKGTKVKRGRDVDYWTIAVGFGSHKNLEWMQLGGGPTWSSGLPLKSDMTSLVEISERDMVCGIYGIDIRGRTKEGKRWRFVGTWGETATYRDASEQAARFFDSIIDGMRCDWEAIPGLGRVPATKR